MRGRSRRAEGDGRALSRYRTRCPEGRQRDRSIADQRLPARRPARDPPRPVVGPRRGDRRQRACRSVQRARKLCGLFPPAAGHEPFGRGQLHQPRRRQGRRDPRGAEREGCRRGKEREGRGQAEGRERLEAVHRRSQREGEGGQSRSADRAHAGGRSHDPDPLPPVKEQPALRRRSRRREDRDRGRPGAENRRGRCA